MKNKAIVFILILCIAVSVIICISTNSIRQFERELGTRFCDGMLVLKQSDHGWFGDGYTFIVIQYKDGSQEEQIALEENWHKLPLSASLSSFLSMPSFNHYFNIPDIETGYFIVYDRNSNGDCFNDNGLMDMKRGTFNFSFAIYDSANRMLYLGKYDT